MAVSSPIQIIIADGHEIYRDGLKIMLRKEEDFEVVAEAANGKDMVALTQQLAPDILLTDIVMPVMDGIVATRTLRQLCPSVKVIALSMLDEDNLVIDMLEAGAKGYLLKNADKSEIIDAIKSVYRNVPYYCRSTSYKLARMISQSRFDPDRNIFKSKFSEKEIKIIKLICQEFTNKEIGEQLFLGTRTVEGYRLRILEKMNAKSTAGIVLYALRNNLFIPEK